MLLKKKHGWALLLSLSVPLLALPARAGEDWRVSSRGYGPVRVGMTVAEAGRAMNTRLRSVYEAPPPGSGCDVVAPQAGYPGVTFLVDQGRIAHVHVTSAAVSTRSGLKVGDSMETVKKALGPDVEVQDHDLDPGSFFLFAWEPGHRFGVKFTTDPKKKVISIQGGEWVGAVEGCA